MEVSFDTLKIYCKICINTKFQDLVQDLFNFRDRFFETHPIEKASEKRVMVDQKMKDVLDAMDKLTSKHNHQ